MNSPIKRYDIKAETAEDYESEDGKFVRWDDVKNWHPPEKCGLITGDDAKRIIEEMNAPPDPEKAKFLQHCIDVYKQVSKNGTCHNCGRDESYLSPVLVAQKIQELKDLVVTAQDKIEVWKLIDEVFKNGA